MRLDELRCQHAKTQCYLGSPSIVRMPDGRLLATHDYFGPRCPLNHEAEEHLSSVYRSSDDGRRWGFVARGDLVGRAFVLFWPPNRMRWLR